MQLTPYLLILTIFLQSLTRVLSQALPNESENIDFISTFSNQADHSFGDEDYHQNFFIVIPKNQNKPFFIRIFDPDTGGNHDEVKDNYSKTRFSIYGGKGCFSAPEAKEVYSKMNINTGQMITSKTFDHSNKYDNQWFVFGPFNPKEGELIEEMEGYIFRITIEGLEGRNGNRYRLFISENHNNNLAIEGLNTFTYKYTFKLISKEQSVAMLYPFVNKDVVSIKVHTFDFDNDGTILLYSLKKNRHKVKHSKNNEWVESTHLIEEEEKNTTLNIQIIKKDNKDNDMAIYITNQFNKPVPFYAIPIGGSTKFRYKININYFSK
ncbi:MAG: hypothetical protein EAZ07_05430 [Cytophagales bacterium]|nr:MAG: hypothetical protein EAZ07_05430 [Cytophagales bacterium]